MDLGGAPVNETNDALHLAELIASRLCHDLAGPLAALIGILEIAQEEHPASEPVALAEQTVVELAQRLKLLRAAWGQATEDLGLAALREHAAGLAGGHIKLDLSELPPETAFPPRIGRLVLNALLLAVASASGSGTVTLSGSLDDGLLITIAGPRAGWPAGLVASLTDPAAAAIALAEADARHVLGPLVVLLARDLDWRLSMLMPCGPAGNGGAVPPLLLTPNT